MTKDVIIAALTAEGLSATQDVFTIPEDREATVLVASGSDVMPVSKVNRIELRDKLLCVHTVKDERFWLPYEPILGLRLIAAKPGKERVAGFAK